MSSLYLLQTPSANRVYASQAPALTAREAHWVLSAHTAAQGDRRPAIEALELAGMPFLRVNGAAPADQRLLSALSATLGAFDGVEDAENPHVAAASDSDAEPALPLLRPRALPSALHHPSDLETTLKYRGKTNEQFTALLVNLAAALSDRREHLLDGRLRLLDPMSGRGTTLNRALRLGLSPLGVEIDAKDVEAYRAFLTTWLRTHRFKHQQSSTRLTRDGAVLGTRVDARFAADKQALRAGREQTLTLLGCDTEKLGGLLPNSSLDALVADLPYGVQHGSRTAGAWKRSPVELISRLAPLWRQLLRRGGGVALAVNRRTTPYAEAVAALEDAGFAVLSADGEFQHRVDQSIDRDVLLAIRMDHPQRDLLESIARAEERPDAAA